MWPWRHDFAWLMCGVEMTASGIYCRPDDAVDDVLMCWCYDDDDDVSISIF